MAENSKIEWTHHTFNPWIGCTKVSAGCAHCYAEADFDHRRSFAKWGPAGTRVVTGEANWNKPRKWDREAKTKGVRERVFCASLADVFEGPETMPADAWPKVRAARVRLFHLISDTPNLDWLLLTKRPQNVNRFCSEERSWSESPPPNFWLGTSVENQAAADERIPHLLDTPAAVRFLSMEPLLGPVDVRRFLPNTFTGFPKGPKVGWVIVGGESGADARPMNLDWARSIVGQCKAAGVACFVKQLGACPTVTRYHGHPAMPIEQPYTSWGENTCGITTRAGFKDKKGGDTNDFPADLRVRELPYPVSKGGA